MCQNEVYKYLARNKGKEVSMNELMLVIPTTRSNISRACRKMVQHKEIRIRPVKEGPFTRYLFSVK